MGAAHLDTPISTVGTPRPGQGSSSALIRILGSPKASTWLPPNSFGFAFGSIGAAWRVQACETISGFHGLLWAWNFLGVSPQLLSSTSTHSANPPLKATGKEPGEGPTSFFPLYMKKTRNHQGGEQGCSGAHTHLYIRKCPPLLLFCPFARRVSLSLCVCFSHLPC